MRARYSFLVLSCKRRKLCTRSIVYHCEPLVKVCEGFGRGHHPRRDPVGGNVRSNIKGRRFRVQNGCQLQLCYSTQ